MHEYVVLVEVLDLGSTHDELSLLLTAKSGHERGLSIGRAQPFRSHAVTLARGVTDDERTTAGGHLESLLSESLAQLLHAGRVAHGVID